VPLAQPFAALTALHQLTGGPAAQLRLAHDVTDAVGLKADRNLRCEEL
jgi:hypothetical protein